MHKPRKNLTNPTASRVGIAHPTQLLARSSLEMVAIPDLRDNFASLPGRSQKGSSRSSCKSFGDRGVADLLHDGTRNHNLTTSVCRQMLKINQQRFG
jgi:hypothetical protein